MTSGLVEGSTAMRPLWSSLLCLTVLSTVLAGASAPPSPARSATLLGDAERSRARQATVQIVALGVYSRYEWPIETGTDCASLAPQVPDRLGEPIERQLYLRGSGTVVSSFGHILTNRHVIDVAPIEDLATEANERFCGNGEPLRIDVVRDRYLIYVSDPVAGTIHKYTADVVDVSEDESLDLALLRIGGDATGQPLAPTDLPFLPWTDSHLIDQGDPIYAYGFPGYAENVAFAPGEVTGFDTDQIGLRGRLWIYANISISSGFSGGPAFNDDGLLVGLVTAATLLDCQVGDVNGDGEIDEVDNGCIPSGSSNARILPINRAATMLAEHVPPPPTSTAEATTVPTTPVEPVTPTATPTTPSETVAMFRGNPARTGEQPGPNPSGPATLLWRFPTGDAIVSSPAVVGDLVFVGSLDGLLYAINAATGQVRWRFATNASIESSPTVAEVDGRQIVYVGSCDGNLYAVDAQSGTELWRVNLVSCVVSSPVVVAGVVYVGGNTGIVYAIDAATGNERRELYQTGEKIVSSPAVVDGVLYVGNEAGLVFAIATETGAALWTFSAEGAVTSTPAVVNGVVYVGSRDDRLYAIEAGTGLERWQHSTNADVEASPAVAGGVVYAGSVDGVLFALDVATGEPVWEGYSLGSQLYSSPVIVGETLYANVDSGSIETIDVETADEGPWSYEFPEVDGSPVGVRNQSSPTVVGGVVYVGRTDGYLYAIGGATARQTAVWQDATNPDLIYEEDGVLHLRVTAVQTADGEVASELHVASTPADRPLREVSFTLTPVDDGRSGYAEVYFATSLGPAGDTPDHSVRAIIDSSKDAVEVKTVRCLDPACPDGAEGERVAGDDCGAFPIDQPVAIRMVWTGAEVEYYVGESATRCAVGRTNGLPVTGFWFLIFARQGTEVHVAITDLSLTYDAVSQRSGQAP
jgi:outer membrane protein assembly factor BamB